MDKAISAAEANRQFSRILREVRAGDTFTVTSHGEKVARIVPIDRTDEAEREKAWQALLDRWQSQPAQNLGSWTREELYER